MLWDPILELGSNESNDSDTLIIGDGGVTGARRNLHRLLGPSPRKVCV